MGLIKRFNRNFDPALDRELDQIIAQLPHKDDIKKPLTLLDRPISKDDLSSFAEGEMKFNFLDSKLYFRAFDNLFSVTATKL